MNEAECSSVGIECLPLAFSRVVNTTSVTPGTGITVSCPAGQVLSNGKYNMTSGCTADGRWMPGIPDCKGHRVTSFNTFYLFETVAQYTPPTRLNLTDRRTSVLWPYQRLRSLLFYSVSQKMSPLNILQ